MAPAMNRVCWKNFSTNSSYSGSCSASSRALGEFADQSRDGGGVLSGGIPLRIVLPPTIEY